MRIGKGWVARLCFVDCGARTSSSTRQARREVEREDPLRRQTRRRFLATAVSASVLAGLPSIARDATSARG